MNPNKQQVLGLGDDLFIEHKYLCKSNDPYTRQCMSSFRLCSRASVIKLVTHKPLYLQLKRMDGVLLIYVLLFYGINYL